MNAKTIFRFVIISLILAALACNLPFNFEEDNSDWSEPEAESSSEEPDYSSSDYDDESPPIVDTGSFQRDFVLPLPLFSPDSAWNQRADKASVLPESDAQILSLFRVLLGDISSLEGYEKAATDWPYMDVSMYEYSIPIYLAGEGEQKVLICEDDGVLGWAHPKFEIETEGGPVTVPAPVGMVRAAGPENDDADGHLVLYDPDTFIAYDYFAATSQRDDECRGFEGGSTGNLILQAGVVDFFDIRGSGASLDGYYSARAVGTPLLAGLILPEDIEAGEIAHALSFAIPGPRNTSRDPYEPKKSDYFYPASTTETDFYNTDSEALASGQRIRLKEIIVDEEGQVIDEGELAPITRIYLAALREYGAYLVDNAGGFTFYAEDVHTAVLHLSDDEVNALIGEPSGTPLPLGMTKWQIVLERLSVDLELIPLAISPGDDAPRPESAEIEIANFEVVQPANKP